MDRNHVMLYKTLVISIIILFGSVAVVPSTLASSQDDIKIYISAGIFRNYWGSFGLGWVLVVNNHGNENISGHFEIDFYTLSGDSIKRIEDNFYVEPSTEFGYEGIDIIDFPPINYLKITVEAGGYNVSRSGIEIGPFVLLSN